MGASNSQDKHPKIGASRESTDSSIESNGEWEDLPPFPDAATVRLWKRHYVLNLKFVGDRCVGKTQLILRFVEDTYDESVTWSDIEPDLWDYKFTDDEGIPLPPLLIQCSNPVFYRAASGVFLVYSKLNKASFEKLSELVHVIKKTAPPTILLTLLGNKCDSKKNVEESECVDYCKAKEFADSHGMAFFEVSAKDGTNVELAVTDMVARIWRTMIKQHSLHHQ